MLIKFIQHTHTQPHINAYLLKCLAIFFFLSIETDVEHLTYNVGREKVIDEIKTQHKSHPGKKCFSSLIFMIYVFLGILLSMDL